MKRIIKLLVIILCFSIALPTVHASEIDLRDEIVYNIIIDRFNNGNQSLSDHINVDDPYNYHGGDFIGITKRLDHLEALGFSTIVLSPIFANAPAGFHGYWVEDFFQLNENYGSLEELKELIDEAHKRGLKVVVEFIFNYASLTNPLVSDVETKDWFKNNEFTPDVNDDSLFWLEDVVQFDQQQEAVQDYLIDVAEFWMDELNIDGFKLHAADQADALFLEQLTTFIKDKDPNFYLFAHILDPTRDITSLQALKTIDAVENHTLFSAIVDTFEQVGNPINELYETWENLNHEKDLLFTETKDSARFANAVVMNDRTPLTAWKLALTYLYTTPGIPYMYQGNELQMLGLEFPETQQMMRFNSTDPDLEEFHEKLSAMRQEIPALTLGDYSQVAVSGGLSIFKRSHEQETVYVAINNDDVMQDVRLDDISTDKQLRGLFADEIVRSDQDGEFIITLPRESVEIYIVQENFGINWYYIAFVALVFVIFFIAIIYLSRKQKLREQQNQ